MEEQVMRQHIDLYVNDYSLALGTKGKDAVHKLLSVYQQLYPGTSIATDDLPIFVDAEAS